MLTTPWDRLIPLDTSSTLCELIKLIHSWLSLDQPWIFSTLFIWMMSWRYTWMITQSSSSRHACNELNSHMTNLWIITPWSPHKLLETNTWTSRNAYGQILQILFGSPSVESINLGWILYPRKLLRSPTLVGYHVPMAIISTLEPFPTCIVTSSLANLCLICSPRFSYKCEQPNRYQIPKH